MSWPLTILQPIRIETPPEVVDGANAVFTTVDNYKPGSVRVWINGLVNRPGDIDSWTELGGNTIQLLEVPIPPDVVRIWYLPAV